MEKLYTTGSIANGTAASSSRLASLRISPNRTAALAFTAGANIKPMPPPAIPPSIQKPQKSSPNSARVCAITRSV